MYCINKSHPEYLNLLQASNEHPDIVDAKIISWMDRFGNSKFPTIQELNAIPTNKKTTKPSNSIKQLGTKYLANKDGFMPANINLADLQRDARKLNLTAHRSSRNTWFLRDNRNRFVNPNVYLQIDSQSSILPYKDLEDKLFLWAEKHGISVITMQEMMDRVTETDSLTGSVAVADLLNRIIALDPDKKMSDTLAEEVSHFATSILRDDASVKKAMENIVNTDIYQQVKEQYADVYSTEEEFRKEAVDKLLAQAIIENFKDTTENTGILAYIKGIWSKFKKFLAKLKNKAGTEIKEDLYPLAQSILANEYLGKVPTNMEGTTMYHQKKPIFSVEKEKEVLKDIDTAEQIKAKFAMKAVNELNKRLEFLRNNAKKAKQKTIASLEKEIETIVGQIDQQEFTLAIMRVVENAKKELVPVNDLLDKMNETGTTDGKSLTLIKNFTDTYDVLFRELYRGMLEKNFNPEDIKSIKNILDDLTIRINDIETKTSKLRSGFSVEFLRNINTDSEGNKIDQNFNEEEILEVASTDTDIYRFFAGNYKWAKSGIIRAAHKAIFDVAQRVKRFAAEKGNELLTAQVVMEKAGYKVEDLIEKTDGKYTQYLIRREDWAGYYKARREMREEVARVLGFEDYSGINYNELNKEQQKLYLKFINDFNAKHTILTVVDGKKMRVPNKKNPRFAELMKNQDVRNYYDLLLQTKFDSLKKLPLQYRTPGALYLLPSIRSQFLERFFGNDKSFFGNLKEVTKEAFFLDEDDTDFGELNALNNRMVPIYFTKQFDDPSNASRDLTRSFTVFAQMAENFKEANVLAGDLETLMTQLGEREYRKGRNTYSGLASTDYKILETLVDAHVYGIEKKDVSFKFPDTPLWKKLRLANKEFSLSKAASKLSKYISTNNLALNPVTSTAGLLKGSIDSIVEDQIGLYTTTESKNWARAEFAKNLIEVLSQTGLKKQTNKMHLMLQRHGVVELNKMLRNTNKNKLLSEVTNKDLLFINFRTADYFLKGNSALSVYDNTRLVDGEFITRKNFLEKRAKEGVNEKEARKEWKNYRDKSLYNAYEVVNGSLQIKEDWKQYVTDGVENSAAGVVQEITGRIDGTLSDTDRGALARTVHGQFILMHRGWFINMIDSRFAGMRSIFRKGEAAERVNFITGESEIGIYPAMMKFIYDDLYTAKNFLKPLYAYNNIANPAVKRGVKKTVLDLIYLQVVAFLTAIANIAADDDDENDFMTQYTAYQMNRVLLEQSAGQPLLNWSEILQIIEEPVVGVRTVKDLIDISELFNSDVYRSGMYKGHTHREKFVYKKLIGFKNIYETQFPKSKNNFLKNQIINSATYDYLSENAADEEIGILERLSLIFKDQQPENTADVIQYIEAVENDEY